MSSCRWLLVYDTDRKQRATLSFPVKMTATQRRVRLRLKSPQSLALSI